MRIAVRFLLVGQGLLLDAGVVLERYHVSRFCCVTGSHFVNSHVRGSFFVFQAAHGRCDTEVGALGFFLGGVAVFWWEDDRFKFSSHGFAELAFRVNRLPTR